MLSNDLQSCTDEGNAVNGDKIIAGYSIIISRFLMNRMHEKFSERKLQFY